MRIFIKTLKNSQFEIQVNADDTVADVKKKIETSQGKNLYPSEEQMLIYQGKVLNDSSTMNDNNVDEDKFIVIMLKKTKASSSGASATATTPTSQAPAGSVSSTPPVAAPATPLVQPSAITLSPTATSAPSSAVAATPSAISLPPTAASAPASAVATIPEADSYGQAASNLVAGSSLEQTIQQIIEMGGGSWDRDTVLRALRAAYNNPERAVEYLYSGIPEQAEAPPVTRAPTSGQTTNPPVQAPQPAQPAAPSSGPNANPLDLFPQGLPSMGSNAGTGNLDFLRNNPQFRTLQAMVQANPQVLQPMLQELGKQNPQVMRLIQDHQAEFIRLMNEPAAEGGESNPLSQLAAAMPQTLSVTPEEREAIERLEAMGFARPLVLQVFFACNKNEELTANYLLDHMHEFENDQ